MDTEEQFYVSWRGNVTGPFSLEQIEARLKKRSISSLSKIQIGEEWVLLRDVLDQIRQKESGSGMDPSPTVELEPASRPEDFSGKRKNAAVPPPLPSSARVDSDNDKSAGSSPSLRSSALAEPGVAPGADTGWGDAKKPSALAESGVSPGIYADWWDTNKPSAPVDSASVESGVSGGAVSGYPGRGLGITAFILSFFFFVPIVNLGTIPLSLFFGHLAIRGGMGPNGARQRPLPWFALWTSYVHAVFLAMVYLLVMSLTDEPEEVRDTFFLLHIQTLGYGVGAALGAGLLMLALRLRTASRPPSLVCYVGALVPIATGAITVLFLEAQNGGPKHLQLGVTLGIMFLIQALLWSKLIQSPQGKSLGYKNAAVVSLVYTIVSLPILLLALSLRAMLV